MAQISHFVTDEQEPLTSEDWWYQQISVLHSRDRVVWMDAVHGASEPLNNKASKNCEPDLHWASQHR